MMKKSPFRTWAVAMLAASACGAATAEQYEPKADASSQVIMGNARFTVLTDRLIRLEYAPDCVFEDRASLTFVNRRLPSVEFKCEVNARTGAGGSLETKCLKLTYAGGPFTADSLKIESKGMLPAFVWHYGDEDTQNLLGTRRTLDGVWKWADGVKGMEKGILSRAGWAVVDDSENFLFEKTTDHWGEWVTPRRGDPVGTRLARKEALAKMSPKARKAELAKVETQAVAQDFYFFGYGHDYKAALGDYVRVAGRIPLPPKWSFGYWWCRYWQYSAAEIQDLVRTMHSLSIPIDVMIIDMEWHDTWGLAAGAAKDCFGESVGWTGYTWKQELFPAPKQLLDWCATNGLKTALNLHPASGIQPQESCYADFAQAYDWQQSPEAIPFRICEAKWADCWFNTVLGPMERDGVDFWWLDWQQWMTSRYIKGLSNTFWLNHVMWQHMVEKSPERPLIYHRWGGLGSHRYQTGFSGDTGTCWDVLAFECWFTATSGNVGYGYWGHDLGGHASGGKPTDPELYTRWMQYGVFSPTFKTHSAKQLENERRIWMHPQHFLPIREAFRLRYRLVPYIYGMARKAYDTGLSLCRPLYWDWPEEESSYAARQIVYQFGDDLLASAVTNAIDPTTGLATMSYTLPSGTWYDLASGAWVEGGRAQTFTYTIDEHPWWARPGAILPLNPPSVQNLQTPCRDLELLFVPGEGGETWVYEDAGTSRNYAHEFATTHVTRRGSCVKIAPRKGQYALAPATRAWTLRFPCRLAPEAVRVNGKNLAFSTFGGAGTWSYDGLQMSVVVSLAEAPVDQEQTIELVNAPERVKGDLGRFRRFVRLDEEYKYSYGEMVHPWAMLPDEYLGVSETASFLQAQPQRSSEILQMFDAKIETFLKELVGKRKLSGPFAQRLAAQMNLPLPTALPDFTCCQGPVKARFEWSLASASPTVRFEVKKIDERHFEVTLSELIDADLKLNCFSGYVRVHPVDEQGKVLPDLVLTRGTGMRETTIFISPYYRAKKFVVEICG